MARADERSITAQVRIALPQVPNFLRAEGSSQLLGATIPLSALTDKELRILGAEWTEALLARAAEQRRKAVQDG